jgi:GST-like protein
MNNNEYTPPEVWTWDSENGGKRAGVNRPIADIAIWSWYGRLAMGDVYDAEEFLDTASYSHVLRWAQAILEREAVQQGLAATR